MEEIKHAAQGYADHYFEERLGNCGAKNGFLAGVKFAQTWISVEDELPEGSFLVLVKNKENKISIGIYMDDLNHFSVRSIGIKDFGKVTYWRLIELK